MHRNCAGLRARLRAGDVWVRGSRRYRNFEDCLLPRPTIASLRAEGPLPLAVPEDADAHLAARRETLEAAMAEVAALAKAGALPDATVDGEGLRIAPLKAEQPPEARGLAAGAYALLPQPRVTDLLLEVEGWTGFAECFTHARSGRPAPDRAALLTAVLADGINLGLTRMAEACRGPTLRQLAWTHDWHVREECYAAALVRLIETHRALPLATAWGDGTTSSSDGQSFRAGGRGEAAGDVNARHGNEPGVAFYTHVSDQFGPFHTKVIAATASEAPHVLDGLLRHGTGLRPAEHYVDTGGATDQVFGLFSLLGIRFAPRLRDLKDRRFYAFRGMAVPEAFAGMTGGTLDADHVRACWDELLWLGVSVASGHVAASDVLRRLAAYPRQNGLAVALRELGRLERTLFTRLCASSAGRGAAARRPAEGSLCSCCRFLFLQLRQHLLHQRGDIAGRSTVRLLLTGHLAGQMDGPERGPFHQGAFQDRDPLPFQALADVPRYPALEARQEACPDDRTGDGRAGQLFGIVDLRHRLHGVADVRQRGLGRDQHQVRPLQRLQGQRRGSARQVH
jgi:TnpA family transposase